MDEYFAGRAAELALLDGLLRRAAAGRGQLAVILGPGWIGKTALIQQFLDDREARVRWVCAARDETGLPGGLLEQLGIAAAGYDADPLRAGSALLAKLRQWAGAPEAASEASGAPGAVLVVDDVQWGDPLSLQALSYALRRLPDTPLLTLLAVRDDEFGCLPHGLVRLISDRGTRLEVAGLGVAEISSLAERVGAGPVPPRAARRLLEHTGGVPQYVREVLQAVPRESLRTALSAPDLLLPSPKSLEARVLTGLAGCSGPARRLVAAAAVLAADLDQDSLLCGAHAAAVYPAAARGRWDTARAHAGAATRYAAAGDRDQLLDVAGARVALAFAMDDPEAVLAAARPVVVELAGLAGVADGSDGLAGLAGFAGAEPALLSFWPLYAHALARVGRLTEAADALAPFAELASARGRGSAIAAAARVEGFIHAAVGRPDAARRAYQAALASLDGLSAPHEEALTRLDYGRFLRHQSQRRAALRELYAARSAFARLGAVPFLARCDAELGHEVPTVPMVPSVPAEPAATSAANAQLSASVVRSVPTWPAPLTARQLAVAEAVAEGKSNRQVARELYVTVKTVEYHVSQIFAKLGIDGRADVAGTLQLRKS